MTPFDPTVPPTVAKPPPSPTWRIVRGLISLVIVVGIFVGVMPQIADYGEVWATISGMSPLEIGSLVALTAWNIVTYWFVMVAALPGLRYPQAAVVNQASTAVANTLPGGGAIGVAVTYAMNTSWGFTVGSITRSVVVSGIWNNFVKLGLPVVALGLLALQGSVPTALIVASLIGIAVLVATIVGFALMLRSSRLAEHIGHIAERAVSALRRMVRRPPVTEWGEAAMRFRADVVDLLATRWLSLTVASVVSHLSLYVVLLTALRHVGVSEDDVSWITVLATFAFVRLISALPITPGGVGVVELGYVASLSVGLDDATSAQVVAAVLVFRVLTYVLPIPFGAVAYVLWRRRPRWLDTSSTPDPAQSTATS